MIINKHIERKILTDYFFIEGKIPIDSNYFIRNIEEAVRKDNNENYKTHVKGQMTLVRSYLFN